LIFLALACSWTAVSKQSKPQPTSRGQFTTRMKVYAAHGKRIRIVAGTKRTLVNLTDDISGCLELYDTYFPERTWKIPLGIKVLDRVSKDGKYYLVLLTSAQSNCNVQGYCGAATDYNMVWLKLSASLKLEEKKSVLLEHCNSHISIIDPKRGDQVDPPIKFVGGSLTIEYGNALDDRARMLSRLVYDRKFPEQGFVITSSEKKAQQDH